MAERQKPAYLCALGAAGLPAEIELPAGRYVLEKVYKHDFFAATALYRGKQDKVIAKFGRTASFFGLPLGWIGRWLASREAAFLAALADVSAVPALAGRLGRNGLAHVYIEGHPLRKGEWVPDDFFPQLRAALAEIHGRGMAYVDLEKCENVIVGDEGRPYLVDFQIAWHVSRRWGGELWPLRAIRKKLQRADLYHVTKLQRRTRPDQLSPEELAASYAKPWYVKLHGFLTRPFTLARRRVLNRLDPSERRGERGRVGD
jgi:hypothetical protein